MDGYSAFAVDLCSQINHSYGHPSHPSKSTCKATASVEINSRKRPHIRTGFVNDERGSGTDEPTLDTTLVDDLELGCSPSKRPRNSFDKVRVLRSRSLSFSAPGSSADPAQLPRRPPTPPRPSTRAFAQAPSPTSSHSTRPSQGDGTRRRRRRVRQAREHRHASTPSSDPHSPSEASVFHLSSTSTSSSSSSSSAPSSAKPSTPARAAPAELWQPCASCHALYRPAAPGAPCVCAMYNSMRSMLAAMSVAWMPFASPSAPLAWAAAAAITARAPGACAAGATALTALPHAVPTSPLPFPVPAVPVQGDDEGSDEDEEDEDEVVEYYPQLPSHFPPTHGTLAALTPSSLGMLAGFYELPTRPKPRKPAQARRTNGGLIALSPQEDERWRDAVEAWEQEQDEAKDWFVQLAKRVHRWEAGMPRAPAGEEVVEYATPEEEACCGPQKDWIADKDEMEGLLAVDERPPVHGEISDEEEEERI